MKRFLTVLTTIGLFLALAGCGATGTTGNAPASKSQSAGQSDPAETKNDPTEAPEAPSGKWVREKAVNYAGDGSVSGRWEYEYDAAGNGIRSLMYDPDGTLLLRIECEYDPAGRQTKFEQYQSESLWGGEAGSFQKVMSEEHAFDGAGNEIRYVKDDVLQWEAEYDAAGTRIRYRSYTDGEFSYYEECETDTSGRVSRVRQQWADGEERYYIPEYDEDGREIKSVGYEPDGRAVYCMEAEYDAAGNRTKRVSRHPEGYWEDHEEWAYDAAGNQIQYTRGDVLRWKKEFDAAGNLTKNEEYSSDGAIDRTEVYEYDANGNLVTETIYQSDGSVSSRTEIEYVWFPLP